MHLLDKEEIEALVRHGSSENRNIACHFSLQKQLFFILLCLAVTSLIFLYQNPQWGLESIRILRHKYDLSSADYGELNEFKLRN